jgi:DNA mismatch repair protein MutL
MADIIKLLSDSVANQIAAGEVVQRPASIVKELVENAVDAGGASIQILIKDAGKTSVQVIDNGCGMSPIDARMAFERHATSKITEAKDLFAIRTLGFRGEALASIAAVAEVKLRTKRMEDELGTAIDISASRFESQEAVACPDGTNFLIRNLFFNTPARRKFLKANNTEFRHIINEFQRVALTHPEIEFNLNHNNTEIYNLPQSNFRMRICNVFGKSLNSYLVPVNADTSIVKISGFIGKPEAAKKTIGEQFFFVNQRFIKHPMLHRAVMKAYEHLLPSDAIPTYFIYFETDPETIDINIHPTKTEVKFEDEPAIFQILVASLREALGKFNIAPSLDFTIDTSVSIPPMKDHEVVIPPSIEINPYYNPFEPSSNPSRIPTHEVSELEKENMLNWEKLYEGFENKSVSDDSNTSDTIFGNNSEEVETNRDTQGSNILQVKNKYILTPVKSGLMIIDQKRAHERILFERYMQQIQYQQGIVQRSLFPETVEFTFAEFSCLKEIADDVQALGFELEILEDNKVAIKGYPAESVTLSAADLLKDMVQACMSEMVDLEAERKEKIAVQLAQASAIPYGKSLGNDEMRELVDHLFGCSMPNFSPSGKPIISIVNLDELEKKFL